MNQSIGKPGQYWFYICGANITVLVALFSTLFRRVLKHWWSLLGMILFIIFTTILVEGDATVVRAVMEQMKGVLEN